MPTDTTRKAFTVKSDENAETGKPLVLEIDWTGMTLEATRALAARTIVIAVQGKLRKKLNTVKAGQVIQVSAVDYSVLGADILAVLAAVPKAERPAWLKARGIEL